jgi:chromosomal replication initiator protein
VTRVSLSPPPPFLLLPENEFARAAFEGFHGTAQSVYLYGPSGVGKSRLAQSVVESFSGRSPPSRIQFLTGSQFAAEFAEASVNKTIPLFQSLTRQLDLFVLEDLQALEGRPETQTQLLSLVNELLPTDCRILWTSRKSPGELKQFHPKLISRFRAGVLAPVRSPSAASRRLLLEHFARADAITISPSATRLLADGLAVSPRELLSVLHRLTALARHDRSPVDADLVRKFLAHDNPPLSLTLEEICRVVARQFGTTPAELRSRKRSRNAALPRQCAMYLARELTTVSLVRIGAFFGKRDHSTVIHACQRIAVLIERESDLPAQLNQMRHALGATPPAEPSA